MRRRQTRRLVALAAIALAALGVGWALLRDPGGYTIRARFVDAGGVVKGGLVEVGGEKVGTVDALRVTPDGQAELELSIDAGEYRPLRRGTRAAIRAVGQAAVANRYVELTPGPRSQPAIRDGGVLDADQTRPIVDIDMLLDSLDGPTRARLRRILAATAKVTAPATARDTNQALRYLNPALTQGGALTREVARDRTAFTRLVVSGAATASALASRREDLEQGVGHAATVLRALAGERAALADALGRAPEVMRRARFTLRGVRHALAVLRPALREAQPVAGPLARLLRSLAPVARRTPPLLADVRRLVPSVRATLVALPPLARVAVPALDSTTSTLRGATPIFAGLRPYGPDIVAGLLNGAGGTTGGIYDANGHLIRMALNEPGNGGVLAPLLELQAGDLRGTRQGLTARCPGGAAEPAPDGSNPWIPDRSLCDPAHNHR